MSNASNKQSQPDYLQMAEGIDELSAWVNAIVARFISDGFTDEQARIITTAMIHSRGKSEEADS